MKSLWLAQLVDTRCKHLKKLDAIALPVKHSQCDTICHGQLRGKSTEMALKERMPYKPKIFCPADRMS